MSMYFIYGSDQKEYGPVPANEIHRWIHEHRVDANTYIRVDGSEEWRLVSTFPEFELALKGGGLPPPCRMGKEDEWSESAERVRNRLNQRDVSLEVTSCFSRGWELVKGNMALTVGGSLIIWFCCFMLSAFLGMIPLGVGNLVSWALQPLAMAGIFWLFIKLIRKREGEIENLFQGIQRNVLHLLVASLLWGLLTLMALGVSVVLTLLVTAPGILSIASEGWSAIERGFDGNAKVLWGFLGMVVPALVAGVLALLVFSVLGFFIVPLTVDKKIDAFQAVALSCKVGGRLFLKLVGFLFLQFVLNLVGVICCCVGLMITMPVGMAAWVYAYEDIFGAKFDRGIEPIQGSVAPVH